MGCPESSVRTLPTRCERGSEARPAGLGSKDRASHDCPPAAQREGLFGTADLAAIAASQPSRRSVVQAKMRFSTSPATSVRRKSRPSKR